MPLKFKSYRDGHKLTDVTNHTVTFDIKDIQKLCENKVAGLKEKKREAVF